MTEDPRLEGIRLRHRGTERSRNSMTGSAIRSHQDRETLLQIVEVLQRENAELRRNICKDCAP